MAIMMAEASQNALKAKKAAISTQLAALDGDIRELDLRQNELEQIQRDVESYTNNYKIYLGKVDEARIEEQMDIRKMVNVSRSEERRVGKEGVSTGGSVWAPYHKKNNRK